MAKGRQTKEAPVQEGAGWALHVRANEAEGAVCEGGRKEGDGVGSVWKGLQAEEEKVCGHDRRRRGEAAPGKI